MAFSLDEQDDPTLLPPDWREKLGGLRPATMPAQIPGLPAGADPAKLLAGLNVPKVPSLGLRTATGENIDAPTSLQLPTKLDPQLINDTLDRVQRTQLVQGALSRGPQNWYTMKHGISTDQPHNAGWDAAKSAASQPLQVAQAGAAQNAAQTEMLNKAATLAHGDRATEAKLEHDLQGKAITASATLTRPVVAAQQAQQTFEHNSPIIQARDAAKIAAAAEEKRKTDEAAAKAKAAAGATDKDLDRKSREEAARIRAAGPAGREDRQWENQWEKYRQAIDPRSPRLKGYQDRLDMGERIRQIPGKDLNLDKQRITELAGNLDRFIRGASAVSTVHELIPRTWSGDAANIESYIRNKPVGREQQAFVQQMLDMLDREEKAVRGQKLAAQAGAVPKYITLHQRDAPKSRAILQGAGLNPADFDEHLLHRSLGGKPSAEAAPAGADPAKFDAFMKSITGG